MRCRPATLLLAALALLGGPACSSGPDIPDGGFLLDVGSVFDAGTALRDAYTGAAVTVGADGKVVVVPHANGVVLLERAGAAATPFSWTSATVYFALTDRFLDGDPGNDTSYGRHKDGLDEVGTWHGGDWKGLTQKLDYLRGLGVDALWISPIVEQVHGWVAGGSGDFKNYGYAGYWAADFTRLDQNWGTEADLQALIDAAHQRGIRVLVDVVMNHPGYATGADLLAWLPQVFKDGSGAAFRAFEASGPPSGSSYGAWNDLVDYGSGAWCSWWGPRWIRAGLGPNSVACSFDPAGSSPFLQSLSFLPDFKTESTAAADVPAFFATKASRDGGTGFTADLGLTPRQYLVRWHTDWVRRLGIDGFRVDTVNNVERQAFGTLKDAGVQALADWKATHASQKLDDAPFFMVAEAYSHGVSFDDLYSTAGFDSVLNFGFQGQLRDVLAGGGSLVANAATLADTYATLGATTSTPGFGVMSYLSSHDTQLFFDAVGGSVPAQLQGGTALLLAPGAVQLFYGDETARLPGPSASDSQAGTRSDMNWSGANAGVQAHFTALGTFRRTHGAVGRGQHQVLASPAGTWAFSRTLQGGGVDDAVVVLLAPPR